jgi:hypothetical protein
MTSLSDHAKPPARSPGSSSTAGSTGSKFDPAKAGAKLPEGEFLRQEADRARTAIANTWNQARANLARGVNPGAWAGEHPWIALCSSAAAGFFAAYALIPSKEEQALRKLAKIEQALSGGAPCAAPAAEGQTDGKASTGGIFGSLGSELMKLLRPALASALSAAISAKVVKDDEDTNGADAGPDAGAAIGSGTAAGLDPSVNPDM